MPGPLSDMGAEFHAIAKSKGWWDDPARAHASDTISAAVASQIEKWGAFISPNDYRRDVIRQVIHEAVVATWPARNVGELMMLLVSEVAEAFEEYRSGNFDKIYYPDHDPSFGPAAGRKPEGGAIELADLIIRLTEMAAQRGMNLDEAVRIKAEYNKGRSHRHGGKLA